ncbi:MAG TPA: branched-chain amino acid ABC transporter permease [Acidimicrobiales bacterium]|nr:branched-chain amino acid ABC transporter permease [Acidimicrobiales bacterium]
MSGAHRISRATPESTGGLAVFGLLTLALATLPWWDADGALQATLVTVLLYLSLAQMWNLLAGFAGLMSIGQQMFVGIGIYALLTIAEDRGVDPYLTVVLAGLVAAALSVPVALFAFRLSGGYFAIGTWVIAEVFRLLVIESDTLVGGDVRSLTRASLGGYSRDAREDITYWLALALAAGATAIVVLALRSRLGLALRAVRDSEAGARGLGVDVTQTRLVVWVVAAFWTGATGAVVLLNSPSVRADSAFSVLRWTALVIFIAVIGGVGSTTGPIIGVLVYWAIDEQFADAETWRFIILGLVAAAMAIAAPRGIYGLIQRWRPVQFFPVRRRVIGPGVGER